MGAASMTWVRPRESSFRAFDVAGFAARWPVYVATRFDTDAQAAEAFGVSTRTIRLWVSRESGPHGRHVARAFACDPAAIPFLTGVDDARL